MTTKEHTNNLNKELEQHNELVTTTYALANAHTNAEHDAFYDNMVNLAENNASALTLGSTIFQELTNHSLKLPECLWNSCGDALMENVNQFMGFYEYAIKNKLKKENAH